MKNFYSLNFDQYPKEIIKLNGVIGEEYTSEEYTSDLTKVVIEKNNDTNLILPFHRFNKNYHTIILSNEKITIKELIDIINNFYTKKELNLIDLKKLDDDDVYDYITEITISKKENPKLVINPIDIMGDKRFLEYITVYKDDVQYMLHVGS